MQVVLLTPENIIDYWHLIKDSISDAMEKGNGETSVFSLYKKLINDQAQAWVVLKDKESIVATATTELLHYEGYTALHLITVSGEGWDDYKELHAELENFAKIRGCKEVQIWGRKGWEKKLKDFDSNGKKYSHTYSVFSMEV